MLNVNVEALTGCATASAISSAAFLTSGMLSLMPCANRSIISGAKVWKFDNGPFSGSENPKNDAISSAVASSSSVSAPTFSLMPLIKLWIISLPHVSALPGRSARNWIASLTPSTIASLMPVTFSTIPSQMFWNISSVCFNRSPQNSIASYTIASIFSRMLAPSSSNASPIPATIFQKILTEVFRNPSKKMMIVLIVNSIRFVAIFFRSSHAAFQSPFTRSVTN